MSGALTYPLLVLALALALALTPAFTPALAPAPAPALTFFFCPPGGLI